MPVGSTVTTPESAMTSLYRGRTIRVLPMDLEHADFAVLAVEGKKEDGSPIYGGVVSFLGAKEQQHINAIVIARMRKAGYDFDHPFPVPAFGLVVLRRVHNG